MEDFKEWKVVWERNGMVGVTDGNAHVEFTKEEWNKILAEEWRKNENNSSI